LQVDFLLSEPPGKPKNTGVGSLSFLQGIFPIQKLNQGLLHCRQILYQLSCQGSPHIINIYFFILCKKSLLMQRSKRCFFFPVLSSRIIVVLILHLSLWGFWINFSVVYKAGVEVHFFPISTCYWKEFTFPLMCLSKISWPHIYVSLFQDYPFCSIDLLSIPMPIFPCLDYWNFKVIV